MSMLRVPASGLPFLQSLVITNKVKSCLVSMAAGRVLAQYAPLPPNQVESYGSYFSNISAESVANFLDTVHSVVPIDFNKMMDYARKFFAIRCEVALGCCQPSCTGKDGVYNMMHVGLYLSKDELEQIAENSSLFHNYVSGFENIYKSLGNQAGE